MLLVLSRHVMCSLRLSLSPPNIYVTFVDESESSQGEVVTDSPGRVDFPSWQLTLHGHSSGRRCPCELLAGELPICSSLK